MLLKLFFVRQRALVQAQQLSEFALIESGLHLLFHKLIPLTAHRFYFRFLDLNRAFIPFRGLPIAKTSIQRQLRRFFLCQEHLQFFIESFYLFPQGINTPLRFFVYGRCILNHLRSLRKLQS